MEKYCFLVHIEIVYWHWGPCIHFSTQTWITSFSPQQRLGRNIAIYGLSFGVGFAAGPLFVPLVNVFEGLPFIVSGILCMLAWSLVFMLKNDFPDVIKGKAAEGRFLSVSKSTMAVAWLAFLGPFGYGFLESSLNRDVSGLCTTERSRISASVTIILASFSVGGIVSQLPLGMLSDKIGRRPVLLIALGGGAVSFFIAIYVETSTIAVMAMFFIAGLFVGFIFSLGISYMSDLTPKNCCRPGTCYAAFSLVLAV